MSGKLKMRQTQSCKVTSNLSTVWPKFSQIVACCGAELSGTFSGILCPNFSSFLLAVGRARLVRDVSNDL